jgi:hypothetical protein
MEESQNKINELAEQLAAERAKTTQLNEKLNDLVLEQQLIGRLSQAGVSDIESALLLAKSRLKDGNTDIDDLIGQLQKEKSHLFGMTRASGIFPPKTAGAHQKAEDTASVLARAAGKAAATGNNRDVQEYLKLRRNYL